MSIGVTRCIKSAAFVLAAMFACADEPTVTIHAAAQVPGTKTVEIRYSVTGGDPEKQDVRIDVKQGGTVIDTLPGNVGANQTAAWDAGSTWPGNAGNLTFVVVVAPEDDGDYLVVDLSGGPSASSYPVTNLIGVPPGGWTDVYKTTKLVLRRIPAGTFLMGSPTGELGRDANELQRQVTLTQDYYIGIFPVTQRQWERVMGDWPSYFTNVVDRDARPLERRGWSHVRGGIWPGDPAGSGQPASGTFIQRMIERTGLVFDLPTEAQWEYACRAGTPTALNSGRDLTATGTCPNMSEVGRYWPNGGSAHSQGCSADAGTAIVGSYLPNAWGLYDMHGNIYEWCNDKYEAYHSSTVDPVGGADGAIRVLKGGNWERSAALCRSAHRSTSEQGNSYRGFGFRIAASGGGVRLLHDDFEQFNVNDFPAATGWKIKWGGAGENKVVVPPVEKSGKAFHVRGVPGWSACVYNDSFIVPDIIEIRGDFLSTGDECALFLTSYHESTWGNRYAGIHTMGGKLYAHLQGASPLDIGAFNSAQWYHIRFVYDRVRRKLAIWKNSVYVGQIQGDFLGSGYTSIEFYSAHSGKSAFLDNLSAFSVPHFSY